MLYEHVRVLSCELVVNTMIRLCPLQFQATVVLDSLRLCVNQSVKRVFRF